MANAVLAPVDRTLHPFPFLRWVDDYLVAVPEERAVPEVLDRFDGALAGRGLARSVVKTAVAPDPAGWLRVGSLPGGVRRDSAEATAGRFVGSARAGTIAAP